MNVLIVGSKGFIGSHALQYFRSINDYEVWGADVVSDYTTKHYFLIDASNSDFRHIFETQSFDVCINCSGAASVPDSITHPLRDYLLNTVNVFKILDAIRQLQPDCKFINLSSAAAYGNPESLPLREGALESPMSPYGYHKKAADDLCHEFFRFFNVGTCSLRIFSVYGNGLNKQLFWDLAQKADSNNKFALYGTGEESRDFIHVMDLLDAILLILKNAPLRGQIINVANGEEVYIKDAVRIFLNALEWNGTYTFSGESRKGDPINWKADITQLKSYGYKQKISLEQGLQQYASWIKEFA